MKTIVAGLLHCLCHSTVRVVEEDEVDEAVRLMRLPQARIPAIFVTDRFIQGEEYLDEQTINDWKAYFRKRLGHTVAESLGDHYASIKPE